MELRVKQIIASEENNKQQSHAIVLPNSHWHGHCSFRAI